MGSKPLQAEWQSEIPGIYFANIITPANREALKFVATNNNIAPNLGFAQPQSNLKMGLILSLIRI